MILNLSITLPDETSASEAAAYLLEQAENTAGQLTQKIIALPDVDESIYMAIEGDREATFFRSE